MDVAIIAETILNNVTKITGLIQMIDSNQQVEIVEMSYKPFCVYRRD